jgi:peptide/nickel transport system substrate-binding protein
VIGSGPFKFVEWVPNDHVTLVKNPDYWDTDNVPYIDNFIFRVVADGNTAIQSVVTGESDIAEVPFAQVEPLRQSSPDLAINNYDTTAFNFYHVNQDPEKQPFFVDIPVRQALHYALDRQLVVDTAYAGFAEVANGTQPVLSFAYAPDRVNTIYNFDPDQARALLEQAGWVDSDGDGVREKDGVKFSFECVYTEGVPTYAQQIPYMQQAWKEVGIEMIPTAVPFPTLSDLVESGGYAMCVQGFSWDFNGDQYAMFGCDQTPPGFNRMRYCNPRFDELREQARVELDDAARLELLIEASNIVNDEMAAGVLFFRQDIYASAPRLHNYVPNGYGEVWSMTKVWVDPS